ncbi:MAG: tRNA (guanosine(46)-N7)-methyltransferase TrmB [Gammaproteobacteria bacterium]
MSDHPAEPRAIRSYVLRAGRMTSAQLRALDDAWPCHGAALGDLDDLPRLFGRRAPLYLEIGTGNGDNLVATAARERYSNHLGCEVHRPGLGHALLGIERLGLRNVRLIAADAHDVLAALGPGSLDGAVMYFPDPWPKKRHHKRRLLSAAFLVALARCLKPSACFWFATDDVDYATQVAELVENTPGWRNLCGPRAWAPRPHRRIVTRFEARARRAGRPVRELLAATVSSAPDV